MTAAIAYHCDDCHDCHDTLEGSVSTDEGVQLPCHDCLSVPFSDSMGDFAEAWLEALVCQTLCAARTRHDEGHEAASILDLARSSRLADNAGCYAAMVRDGYFIEEESDGQRLVFPTTKLTEKVRLHLKARAA